MANSRQDEIAKLEALFSEHPEGRVFTHLAEAYRKAGELERAREILEHGIVRHPDYSSAHVVLGRVLQDLGEQDGAQVAYETVLQLDPHNLVALRNLGDLHRAADRPDQAARYYRELLGLDPGNQTVEEVLAELEGGTGAADRPAAAARADEGEGFDGGMDFGMVGLDEEEERPADGSTEVHAELHVGGLAAAGDKTERIEEPGASGDVELEPLVEEGEEGATDEIVAEEPPGEDLVGELEAAAPEHDEPATIRWDEPGTEPEEEPATVLWQPDIERGAEAEEPPTTATFEGEVLIPEDELGRPSGEIEAEIIFEEDAPEEERPGDEGREAEAAAWEPSEAAAPEGEPAGEAALDEPAAYAAAEEAAPREPAEEPAAEAAADEPAPWEPAEEPAPEAAADEPASWEPAEEPAAEAAADEPMPWEPAEEPAAEAPADEPMPWESAVDPAAEDAAADEPVRAAGGAWEEPETEEPPLPAQDVATETMGDLYYRQGLYQHAADVYRRLLQDRPNEPRLKSKLVEAERKLAPSSEGAEPPVRPEWGEVEEAPAAEDTAVPASEAAPPEQSAEEPAPWEQPTEQPAPWEEAAEEPAGAGQAAGEPTAHEQPGEEPAFEEEEKEVAYFWGVEADDVEAAASTIPTFDEPEDEAHDAASGSERAAAEAAPPPADSAAPEPEGPSTGEYLSAILGWRPSTRAAPAIRRSTGASAPAADEEASTAEWPETPEERTAAEGIGAAEETTAAEGIGAAEEITAAEGIGAAEEITAAEGAGAAEEPEWLDLSEAEELPSAEGEDWAAEAAPVASAGPESPNTPATPPTAAAPGEEEAFPWDSEPTPDYSPASFFGGTEDSGSEAVLDLEQEAELVDAGSAGGAGEAPPPVQEAAEGEDDEDLEMFRSWLQNLKR